MRPELTCAAPGLRAIDVATGTGHTALALAAAGCTVTGIDPTPAMLSEAAALAQQRGLAGAVRWVAGVAEALPVPAACADIVTCRRAAHHFSDLPGAVTEMARVLRPGGVLGVSDMCPEAPTAAAVNRLERLRDDTHVAAADEGRWCDLLAAAGLRLIGLEISVEDLTLAQWLAPVAPDGPEAAAVAAALEGLPVATAAAITGGSPGRWRKRRVVLTARRPG